jgi:Glycosyl hydrolase family 79 C-terminal beta domain
MPRVLPLVSLRRRLPAAAASLSMAAATAAAVPPPAAADAPVIGAQVSNTAIGPARPSGFVSLSLEFRAVHVYTGRDPDHINPVLVSLLHDLAPEGSQVLRIGGNSTDQTWWPMRRVLPPAGVRYGLTPGWMRTTKALAQAARAKLILGVNLAARRPDLAAAEARALLAGIGRRYIQALEIGNEPDLYPVFAWFRDRRGRVVHSRSRHYSLATFSSEFARWRAAMPRAPLAGPTFSSLTWMPGLNHFLATQPNMGVVTFHRYPLRGCINDPTDPSFASIDNLLMDSSSAGLASQVAPYVQVAHNRGLPFRLDELNSAACSGKRGVSDTFAASLWLLDTLFNVAAVGVDGVNLHTLPGAAYEPFTFTDDSGGWHAFVHPSTYGAMMFDRAFPPGARLLSVSAPAGPVKVWATRAPDGHVRTVVINKQAGTPVTVNLQLPQDSTPLSAQELTAPSLAATTGVTLDGQSFGNSTDSGRLAGPPSGATIQPLAGSYSVQVPAGSAVMVTQ